MSYNEHKVVLDNYVAAQLGDTDISMKPTWLQPAKDTARERFSYKLLKDYI